MAEFFTVRTPAEAWALLLGQLQPQPKIEDVTTFGALDRVLAHPLTAPQDLPNFVRSTMDGYAVTAADTYGASDGLPAFLTVVGEVPMGQRSTLALKSGEAALVHTGGMIPAGSTAVVMIEQTQTVDSHSIEVLRAVADGENLIRVGEDVAEGEPVLGPGRQLRPQDIGALLALGITSVQVARPPRVAILSTGDEIVSPDVETQPGQVRDINSYTLGALAIRAGGEPILHGIVPDNRATLEATATTALADADMLVMSAGSSVSYRDMSVEVIDALGDPGVLVHGISVRPGKPTIVAVCNGKPVFGLPGNPVSAMVIFDLLVTPTIRLLMGDKNGMADSTRSQMQARLARNVASVAGREDYVQVRVEERDGENGHELWAVPVLGKSNLIYTLVHAQGAVKVPLDAGGVSEGDWVTVYLY